MTYLLKVENVVKNYNEKSVLDKVCFSMKEGEIIGLAGPNGAGKTTLLDIVSGFEYADDGKIFFEGVQINEFSEKETADLGIKRTFQEKRPFTGMSVKDNLTVGGQSSESEMLHWSLTHRYQFTQEILQTVNKLLTKFNLQKVSNEYAGNLSGGQKRIVELGKSAASDPNLILLDEPFTGVDPEITKQMIEHIRDLKKSGISFLITEHNLKELDEVSDKIKILYDGNIIAEGNLEELKEDKTVVDAYLGSDL